MRWFALFVIACGAAQESGPYHAGNSVSPPAVIYKVEAAVIDERGKPTNLKVARPLGLGLD
jgi:hypothetical protein